MSTRSDSLLIADRTLDVRRPDGSRGSVHIAIYEPAKDDDDADNFSCRYKIHGISKTPLDYMICGVDGIQALWLCLQTIANELAVARIKHGLEFFWPDGSVYDDLGFPDARVP